MPDDPTDVWGCDLDLFCLAVRYRLFEPEYTYLLTRSRLMLARLNAEGEALAWLQGQEQAVILAREAARVRAGET
jgi:hypothetical protein